MHNTDVIAAARPSIWRTALTFRFDGALLGLLLCAAGGLSAPLTRHWPDHALSAWLVDLAAHWQWLYAAGCVLFSASLLWRGRARWLVPLAGGCVLLGWSSASPSLPLSAVSGPTLTVVTANVWLDNEDLSPLRRWLSETDADLVVLQEVTARGAAALDEWHEFPYRHVSPEEGPFGMAVLSRSPLLDVEALDTLEQTLRYRARLVWDETEIAFSAVHPMPPISVRFHELRSELLATESRWLATQKFPGILAGDFNATPWSAAMKAIEQEGLALASTKVPSWPAAFALIPIDHVAVSRSGWLVTDRGVGPRVGSDHRPVYIRLSLVERGNH